MKNNHVGILYPEEHTLRLITESQYIRVDREHDELPSDALGRVLAALSAEASPQTLILALSSRECFNARIDLDQLPRQGRRQAMRYRLEEKLADSAEDMIADFVVQSADGQALGIACTRSTVNSWQDAIQSQKLVLGMVLPAALLDLQCLLSHRDTEWGDNCRLHLKSTTDHHMDVIQLTHGKLSEWQYHEDIQSVRRRAQIHRHTIPDHPKPDEVYLVNGDSNDISELQSEYQSIVAPGSPLDYQEPSERESLFALVHTLLTEKQSPLVRFHLDENSQSVYRRLRPLAYALGIACTLAFLTLLCSWAIQWQHAQHELAAIQIAEETLYQSLYPKQQTPQNIHQKLQDDLNDLHNLQNPNTSTNEAGFQDALTTLIKTLQSMPDRLRYRIDDIQIQGRSLQLNGMVRSHSDAERIAQALSQSGHFEVDQPKTDNARDQGVRFFLIARPVVTLDPSAQIPAGGDQ